MRASDCPRSTAERLGAASHLMRMFPVQKVRRMLFTGEPISAQEAYRLGALEAIVTRDELMPRAREIARSIAAKSPKAMRLAKESLNGIELLDIKRSYRFEQGFTLELYTSPDSQEARDAFVEKREASFSDKERGIDRWTSPSPPRKRPSARRRDPGWKPTFPASRCRRWTPRRASRSTASGSTSSTQPVGRWCPGRSSSEAAGPTSSSG